MLLLVSKITIWLSSRALFIVFSYCYENLILGFSSKIHDSRIYKLSFLYPKLPHFCNRGKYHLLGDSAYPIAPWLITPFPTTSRTTPSQIDFNNRLCGTRVLIENTFGLLKSRFRQLISLDFHNVEKIAKFITSCCVLHNICIRLGDNWNLAPRTRHTLSTNDWPRRNTSTAQIKLAGQKKRNEVKESFGYQ